MANYDIDKIKDDGGNAYNFRDADAARNVPTFSQASSRANLNGSGETMLTILGKIKKWFADLKAVAFTGSYNDLVDKPTIPPAITVDSAMSSSSTNPVQNKVITDTINKGVAISLQDMHTTIAAEVQSRAPSYKHMQFYTLTSGGSYYITDLPLTGRSFCITANLKRHNNDSDYAYSLSAWMLGYAYPWVCEVTQSTSACVWEQVPGSTDVPYIIDAASATTAVFDEAVSRYNSGKLVFIRKGVYILQCVGATSAQMLFESVAGGTNGISKGVVDWYRGASVPSITWLNAAARDGSNATGTWGINISGNAASATNATNHIANTSNPHSVTKAQVGLGNLPNVNPGISHMYFNTLDYALRINVGDFTIRNAGVSLLVQAVCNNGYVAIIEISCWKGRKDEVERVEAHVLYRNDRSEAIPQFVSYKASTSAENYIYIYSKTSVSWSTSFTVLGNSQRLAENNESLVCEQVSRDEATAAGTTEVSVGMSDAFVATRASTGTDANNTKPADIYNAIRYNRPIIVHDMYREADEYQYVLVDPSSNSNKVRLTCLYIDNSTNSYQRLNAYEITLSNGNGKWDDIDVDLLKYTWATAQNSYFSGTSRLANYATNAGSADSADTAYSALRADTSSSSEKLRKSIDGTDVDFAFDSSSSATKPKLALYGSQDPQLGVFATTATSGTSAHGVQLDADVSGENRVGVWGYHGGKSDWVCYKGSDAICGLGAPYKNSSNPGDQKVRLGRYLVDFSGAPPSESDTIAFM